MAALAAGSAPAGEGGRESRPKVAKQVEEGRPRFRCLCPRGGGGAFNFSGSAARSLRGARCNPLLPRDMPPQVAASRIKAPHLTHARMHSATSSPCVFSHPQFTHIPQAHLQKRLLRFPGRK